MVVFNECRISDDGKCLVLDISIDTLSYFRNCHIEGVWIDTDDTVSSNGVSEKAVSIDMEGDLCECVREDGKIKSARLFIKAKDLNLDSLENNLFFIYVKGGGYPEPGCPCGMDNEWHMCATAYYRPIYDSIMSYIKELSDTCSIPRNFIDLILKLKAIRVSLDTGNYPVAVKLWKQWKAIGREGSSFIKKCGCNGY